MYFDYLVGSEIAYSHQQNFLRVGLTAILILHFLLLLLRLGLFLASTFIFAFRGVIVEEIDLT